MKLAEWIKRQANAHNVGSYANKLRKQRKKIYEQFFRDTYEEKLNNKETISILDIGGTVEYWADMGFSYIDHVDITLANLELENVPESMENIHSIVADGTNLIQIQDKQFDFVFSNSCIEHVGDLSTQARMANEMRRVADHYYLQTPNYYFPIEPHFLFPLFQFLPLRVKAFLIYHFQLGFWIRGRSKEEAEKFAAEVRLLRYKDLKALFPDADIKREKVLGLTKSFMVFE